MLFLPPRQCVGGLGTTHTQTCSSSLFSLADCGKQCLITRRCKLPRAGVIMACRTPYSMRVCKYRKTGAWDINTLSAERSLRIYYSVLFISLVKETHTALGLFFPRVQNPSARASCLERKVANAVAVEAEYGCRFSVDFTRASN